MQKESDLLARFVKATSSDNPTTKLWKYRSFLAQHPPEAAKIKDKMLELALKNKLIGEYEAIFAVTGVKVASIPRTGEYNRLKEEFQTTLNKLKVEASQYEQVVPAAPLRTRSKKKSRPTSKSENSAQSTATTLKARPSTPES